MDSLKKHCITILTLIMTLLISCNTNNEYDPSSEYESVNETYSFYDKKSDIRLEFSGAYINNELVKCRFYIDEKYNLYENFSNIIYDEADTVAFGGIKYKKIELTEDYKNQIKNCIMRLDDQCLSRLKSIYEQPPLIYFEYVDGCKGMYIYGEPENKAFNEIVTICIDNASYKIFNMYGMEYKPIPFLEGDFSSEPHPCLS